GLARTLEMPEEPREKPVALVVTGLIKPSPVGWRAIDVVIARAAEHLAREFDAFLRRVRLYGMEVSDPRREPVKKSELQLDLRPSGAEIGLAMPRIWVNRLPDAGNPVDGILRQQSVEEGRAAARKAGDEDRPRERPPLDRGILTLRIREDQKRLEHPFQVPPRSEASKWRQRRLLPEA